MEQLLEKCRSQQACENEFVQALMSGSVDATAILLILLFLFLFSVFAYRQAYLMTRWLMIALVGIYRSIYVGAQAIKARFDGFLASERHVDATSNINGMLCKILEAVLVESGKSLEEAKQWVYDITYSQQELDTIRLRCRGQGMGMWRCWWYAEGRNMRDLLVISVGTLFVYRQELALVVIRSLASKRKK